MSARGFAERYLQCLNAHDAEAISDLFSEDAWLRPPPPPGGELHGREAIRAFYSEVFTVHPDVAVDHYTLIGDGSVCRGAIRGIHEWVVGA